MIQLTIDEALLLLKNLSAIEGYLLGIGAENQASILEAYAAPSVDLLWHKLEKGNV